MALHFRDLRLYTTAGIQFPTCHARPNPANNDPAKARLPVTTVRQAVTCERCLRRMRKGQPPPPRVV